MTMPPTRLVGMFLVLVATVVLAAFTATVAPAEPAGDTAANPAAEPGTEPASNPDTTTLPLADLGSSKDINFSFTRNVTSVLVTFTVPRGLNPVSLTATLQVPVDLLAGRLTISQEDRSISRLDLPTKDAAPVVVPLAGVQVTGGRVKLRLTMSALPPEGFCLDTPVTLAGGAITFTGREPPPDTVATFLPPVLRKLSLTLPPNPSSAESNAAVQLAAVVAERYSGREPELVVTTRDDSKRTPPAPPTERTIIIREGPDNGLSLQPRNGVPALLISGSGDDLANQARLLGDSSLGTALGPDATAGPLSYDQRFADGTTTLGDLLNSNGLAAEGIWPQVGIRVDQTQFGHALIGVRLHLIGSHTPLPELFGGELLAVVDGQVIDRWPVEPTGVIDRRVSVPNRFLNRSTVVDVKLRTAGNSGSCGDRPTVELRIDGDTELQTQRADPPVPPGFRSLPQTLLPSLQIGIGPDTFGDTVRAVKIISGLQQASGVPLAATVTTLDEAIDGRQPAILIAAGGWTSETIALPVSTDNGATTVDGVDPTGKPTAVRLDSDLPLGSLQTIFDGQRSILVATSNGAPAQLDALLRWLGAERGRWGGLDGRAVISVPGVEPVTLPNPDIDTMPISESTRTRWEWWFWIAGAVVAIAAVGAILILLRAHRERTR